MYLDVSIDSARPPVLHQPDDFKTFKVVVHGGEHAAARLTDALAGIGRVDADGDAFLAIDAVKRLAGERASDPAWQESFAAMVDYARSKGWLGAEGDAIRAHCETVP